MTNQFEKNSTGKNPKNRKEDFSVFEKNNKLEAKLSEKPANIAELERLAEEKELVVENQLTEDIKNIIIETNMKISMSLMACLESKISFKKFDEIKTKQENDATTTIITFIENVGKK